MKKCLAFVTALLVLAGVGCESSYGPAYTPQAAAPPAQVVPTECEGFLRGQVPASTPQIGAFCLSQGCGTCDAMTQAGYPACGIYCNASMARRMTEALLDFRTHPTPSGDPTPEQVADALRAGLLTIPPDGTGVGPFPAPGAPATVVVVPTPAQAAAAAAPATPGAGSVTAPSPPAPAAPAKGKK